MVQAKDLEWEPGDEELGGWGRGPAAARCSCHNLVLLGAWGVRQETVLDLTHWWEGFEVYHQALVGSVLSHWQWGLLKNAFC